MPNPFSGDCTARALARALRQSRAVGGDPRIMRAIAEDFAEFTGARPSGQRRFLKAFEGHLARRELGGRR